MILAINTGSDKNSIAIYSSSISDEVIWQSSKTQSQELLPKIDELLTKHDIKLSNLRTIAVYQGPGSYTGLRVGIAVANSLAWSLNIPIIGVKIPSYKLSLDSFDKLRVASSQLRSDKLETPAGQIPNKFQILKTKNKTINLVTQNQLINQPINQLSALKIAKKAYKSLSPKKLQKFSKIIEPIYQSIL